MLLIVCMFLQNAASTTCSLCHELEVLYAVGVLPPLLPLVGVARRDADVADRSVEPHVKHLHSFVCECDCLLWKPTQIQRFQNVTGRTVHIDRIRNQLCLLIRSGMLSSSLAWMNAIHSCHPFMPSIHVKLVGMNGRTFLYGSICKKCSQLSV